ncbi:MAG: rod shape-determining protein MreC [Planctomycetes bacterium]|nr:rod shape-determining protein MreC [Planctomycetota bacterium]
MTNKPYNRSKRMLFTGLLLSSVVLLLIPHDVTGKLQTLVTGVFSLPLRIGRIASLAARVPLTRDSASASEFHRLQLDNRELANHIANLEARLSEQEAEIERLSRFRSTPNWERTGFIPADATYNLSADRLVINRGLKDGVRVGQYVIASNAIIGLICESEAGNSRLALVSDPKCRIPAYIQSDQTSDQTLGMVTGMGQGKVKITNVKSNQTVKAGDKVYAKAWPGRLEQPFLIGEVQEVKDDRTDPLLLDISVRPAAKLLEFLKVSVIHCGQPI